MRSPVGSLAACARALSRKKEREGASSRGGGNGSSSNQPCAIRTCTLCRVAKGTKGMYERKKDDSREKVKQERERER